MLRVWTWSRGGLGGTGHLPEHVLGEAVLNLAALDEMNAQEAELRARDDRPKRRRRGH